jgi:uncharacterized membrane protein (Fun14 family)
MVLVLLLKSMLSVSELPKELLGTMIVVVVVVVGLLVLALFWAVSSGLVVVEDFHARRRSERRLGTSLAS